MQDIRDSELTYGRGYVYSLQYHLVWCTKYRKKVLVGDVADCLKALLYRCAEQIGCEIMEMEVMPDHVHMLLDCSPQFFIANAVKIFKGNTARCLFLKYPEIKRQLWGGHLWNPSYCIITVSDRSKEQIREYIRSQKVRDKYRRE